MEDFKEQYHRELAYQEIKSNKHTLKGFSWFLIAVAFIWLLTVTGFFEVDKKLITIAFLSNIVLFDYHGNHKSNEASCKTSLSPAQTGGTFIRTF